MTNEQIQKRAIELFEKFGAHKNRHALNELINEVINSGRYFEKNNLHIVVGQLAWAVYPIPDFLQEKVNVIQNLIGKMSTIVKMGESGFCQRFFCKIEKVFVRNYAQYNNVICVQYRQKRKQKSFVIYILPHTEIAIYLGEVFANTRTMGKVKQNNAFSMTDLGTAFDEEHFTTEVNSISVQPVFINKTN